MRGQVAWIAAACLTFAGTARALERTSARADLLPQEPWSTGQSCTVRYYNICTGWVWVWAEWDHGEQVGTAFTGCCRSATLELTSHLTFSGLPAGWGYTGTIEVYEADAEDCPTGPALARQAWQPPVSTGWQTLSWHVPVPEAFVVLVTWGAGGAPWTNSTGLASEHPAAGPTGPQACGTCFPSSRQVRSYGYGLQGSPLCPGVPFRDAVCEVEFLCDASLACPVHVTEGSWGKIKSLYR
jgi:hypothetical protein